MQIMETRDLIAQNIKQLVTSSTKTVEQIAKEVGIHKSVLYHYMAGDNIPNAVILKELCKALHCSCEDILGEIK